MKIVIAMDSLKGSLTSMEAGQAAARGLLAVDPKTEVIVKPLADGGEGTSHALIEGMKGETIELQVTGPMGKHVKTTYGYIGDTQTALIEMASAAGLTLVEESNKNPARATTRGVGEMILDAMQRGARHFIIGLGGSATNDGGIGMLTALGFRFLDEKGREVGQGAEALRKIETIQIDQRDKRLSQCVFHIACDVNNPLCGKNGATYVYGPQKGIEANRLEVYDSAMAHYAWVTERTIGEDWSNIPGSGAAGGLGFAFVAFLNGTLVSGIDLVLEAIELESDIKDSDLVITGEGRLDHQTAMGKAPIGVAKLAKKYGVPTVAFAGVVGEGAQACNLAGIDAYFPILREVTPLEEAMQPERARKNLRDTAEQVFRLIDVLRKQ
ncbi:MAG: glycerate kinase [Eubacteriaceae bacterium]|jgi:glycerate kinase|nr:glycerate kinase [Eubacteriaceae bacterium]